MIELLNSLTDNEINFICNLDYGNDFQKHKNEFLKVIKNEGYVDLNNQNWYPYEVIELGSNWLQEGHEKEFTVCTLIVLKNILNENDLSNDIEIKLDNHSKDYESLNTEYRTQINDYINQIIEKC